MAGYRELVEEVIREASEPLTADEVLRRVERRERVTTANPRSTIRNALTGLETVEAIGRGRNTRYVYVAHVLTGSSFRIPLINLSADGTGLGIGLDVVLCLRSAGSARSRLEREVVLDLAGGPTVATGFQSLGFGLASAGILHLPAELRAWLEEEQRAGGDALVLRCLDGEAGGFSLEGIRSAQVDQTAVSARNEQVLAAARDILSGHSVYLTDFGLRLLARGAYRGEPQPDPLPQILFDLDGRFVVGISSIAFRPDLTPALLRVFGERMRAEQGAARLSLRELEVLRAAPEEEREEEPEEEATAAREPARRLYRLRVRLQWMPGVWRVVEMLDNQTLEDLHDAIQDAFDWDRDHLYAFYLSGKAWDQVTEVQAPPWFDRGDAEPPYTDEVALCDLELKPRQRILYLFDFGDQLEHDVEVLEVLPAPAEGSFPRIAEVHGEAPPQYPGAEE